MYYEETILDGKLFCRSSPDGEWRLATTPHATSVNALLALNQAQRESAFSFFCRSCGAADPKCQCWNDE